LADIAAHPYDEEPFEIVGTRAPLTGILAAILLGLLTAVPGGPVPIDPAFAAAPNGRLVVTWRDAAPATLADGAIRSFAASEQNGHRSVVVAKRGRAAEVAAHLQGDPRVATVVPDAVGRATDWPEGGVDPDDELWIDWQDDMRLIGMPSAWQITTGSTDVVVAVIDTGYEATHEDLEAVPIVSRRNIRTGTNKVTDGYGHGTHVAGTIAASTNNGLGVASMAPGVTIMPVKVLDSNGYGYWSDFLDGVDWAVDHGADVINMSLGSSLSAQQVASWQPTFTAAWEAGTMVIAAAGNNNNNNPFYPASFANVVSVAATTNGDVKASFSNFGPAIDVAAPGFEIASAFKNNTYYAMSGTSMATPHVAGLAALIRSQHPEFTLAEVETAIKATALDLGDPGRDDVFGHGRIQPPLALTWLPPDTTAPIAAAAVPLAGQHNVPESVQPVIAFDEPVTGVDATSVRIRTSTGIWLDAAVTYDGVTHRATIEPAAQLASNTTYRIVVGGAIADLAGNFIIQDSWGFTTGDTVDPTVLQTHPIDASTGVWRGVTITITVDERVTGVSGETIRLRNVKTGDRVAAKVTYDKATGTFALNPVHRLLNARWYRVRILHGIEDLAGNNLAESSFTFKTRA
jgi:subtilisin family serine protease